MINRNYNTKRYVDFTHGKLSILLANDQDFKLTAPRLDCLTVALLDRDSFLLTR
jgi:hypothetical protein